MGGPFEVYSHVSGVGFGLEVVADSGDNHVLPHEVLRNQKNSHYQHPQSVYRQYAGHYGHPCRLLHERGQGHTLLCLAGCHQGHNAYPDHPEENVDQKGGQDCFFILLVVSVKLAAVEVAAVGGAVDEGGATDFAAGFFFGFLLHSPLDPLLHAVLVGVLDGPRAPAGNNHFAGFLAVLQAYSALSLMFLSFLELFELADQVVLDYVHGGNCAFGFGEVDRDVGGLGLQRGIHVL